MDETPTDNISVFQIHAGDGDGADIVFKFNGQLIAVSIFPSSSIQGQKQNTLNDHLIDVLGRAVFADIDNGDYDELVDEVLGVILEAGRTIFTKASAPSISVATGLNRNLQSFLSPATLTFQLLRTTTNTTTIAPIDPDEAYTHPACEAPYDISEEDDFQLHVEIPRHSTKEITITEVFLEGYSCVASRVWAGNKEMFCKAQGDGRRLAGSSIGRELISVHDIRKRSRAKDGSAIRVPQLLGYVVHADTGNVVGFLRKWVSGCQLKDFNILTTSTERRQKWVSRIRETIDSLHAAGIVWGDRKPSNIIIDEGDDAWLIDFGGEYTTGWVDEELADKVQGDEQAIGNIERFLGVE